MNNSYKEFSNCYDLLMQNVNYKVGCDYISDFFSRYGISNNAKIADFACGSGTLTKLFIQKGYDVVGTDLSLEMLIIAKNKCENAEFICADMTSMTFLEEFDGAYCTLDSINHLENEEKVVDFLKCAYNSLKRNGVFIFDANTPYKHNEILSDNDFVFDEEGFFLSWDNENIGDNTVRILIDIFKYNGKNYDRFSEEFYEKAYSVQDMTKLIEKSGFTLLGVYDNLTLNPPKSDSERLFFVLIKK